MFYLSSSFQKHTADANKIKFKLYEKCKKNV